MVTEIVPQHLHGLEFLFDSHLVDRQRSNHGSIVAILWSLAIQYSLQGDVRSPSVRKGSDFVCGPPSRRASDTDFTYISCRFVSALSIVTSSTYSRSLPT